jgi:hypothetical protein
MLLPLHVPWFKVNQFLQLLLIDLRFQPLCWITLSSLNPLPGWSQLQQIEPEIFPSISLNLLLDWWRLPLLNHLRSAKNWWRNRPKNPQNQTNLGGQNPKGFIQEKTCRKLQPEPDSPISASNVITFNQSQSTSKMVVCNWCVVRCWRWRWRILDTYFTFSCSLYTWINLSNVGWYK